MVSDPPKPIDLRWGSEGRRVSLTPWTLGGPRRSWVLVTKQGRELVITERVDTRGHARTVWFCSFTSTIDRLVPSYRSDGVSAQAALDALHKLLRAEHDVLAATLNGET